MFHIPRVRARRTAGILYTHGWIDTVAFWVVVLIGYTTFMAKSSASSEQDKNAPHIHNRRATFDYHILEKFEAGIALVGSEVKSIRLGRVQLGQAFAVLRGGEAFLLGCHIDEYEQANKYNHDPTRTRKLLLHRRELLRLGQRLQADKGLTLICLDMYFKRGNIKVCLAVCKGKTKGDKREAIKERDVKREMQRAVRRGGF